MSVNREGMNTNLIDGPDDECSSPEVRYSGMTITAFAVLNVYRYIVCNETCVSILVRQ